MLHIINRYMYTGTLWLSPTYELDLYMRKRIAITDKDIYEYKNEYIKRYIQVWTRILSLNYYQGSVREIFFWFVSIT